MLFFQAAATYQYKIRSFYSHFSFCVTLDGEDSSDLPEDSQLLF